MNKCLDNLLCKAAPYLFIDRHASMRTTAMCWGFDCGNGWYKLIKEAAAKLEPLCRAAYEEYAPLEKWWYKYIRFVLRKTLTIPSLGNRVWDLVYRIIPGLDNAFYYYGGAHRAAQVKEKFGTLRFYMTHETEEMADIIDEAVRKSAVTCETCGRPGKLRGNGWVYTACWKHTKKEDK